ncbi:MAG: ATP synthase F1 subunit gamma [Proteobacteria bacterium]|nr:ATP synthase F1 subunit gamma [Pseudomonadota bacterium]
MANLKQIRKHIASVQNTGKITKAMKMVAVSKLRKSQAAVIATRPYVNTLIGIIERLVRKTDVSQHPLLRCAETKKTVALIVVSGDKGLCGAYNHNIVKAAKRFVTKRSDQYKKIKLFFIGTKAFDAMKRVTGIEMSRIENAWDKPSSEVAFELSKYLCSAFTEGALDEVLILYTRFKSVIQHDVMLDALLPLQSILSNHSQSETDQHSIPDKFDEACYIHEPSEEDVLDALLPRAVSVHIHRGLLEGLASENGARMTAMDSASKNATEMINRLTLQYNRARQAAITTELIEVVSGAEAL